MRKSMKYIYLLLTLTLTGCITNMQSTLINPVNGRIVTCDANSNKPGEENAPFENINGCVQQYQDMGFWKK